MSTRLEELIRLRNRVDQELKQERLRVACEPGGRDRVARAFESVRSAEARLAHAGYSITEVRPWAQERGLIPVTQNFGRIAGRVLDAFLDAHQGSEA